MLTGDQELLAESSARFIDDTMPLESVRRLSERPEPVGEEHRRKAAELGWFAMLVPEEHGGGSVSGHGVQDACVIAVQHGSGLHPVDLVGGNVVADSLVRGGSDRVRAELLPSITSGHAVAAWADPDPSRSPSVTAGPTGDHFVLDGEAPFVIDATAADHFLIATAEFGSFLVPSAAAGLTVETLESFDMSRNIGRLHLDGVHVPDDARVNTSVDRQVDLAAVLAVHQMVGAMDRLLTMTVEYAKDRVAFGRPIGSFQAIKHLLADTSLLYESSAAIAEAAAKCLDEDHAASEVASIAKAKTSDAANQLVQNCWAVFAGIAFTWEHDFHLFLRRLASVSILYGDSDWHRERICNLRGV